MMENIQLLLLLLLIAGLSANEIRQDNKRKNLKNHKNGDSNN